MLSTKETAPLRVGAQRRGLSRPDYTTSLPRLSRDYQALTGSLLPSRVNQPFEPPSGKRGNHLAPARIQ